MKKKYYVTMTDSFLSGWGMAKGKKNKLVFECGSYEEAETVAENARNRNEMKYVNIYLKKPYYNPKEYYTQEKTKKDNWNWYQKGYFSS